MRWAKSLVRLAAHEVEGLQLRLAEVVERRTIIERRIAAVDAEVAAEVAHVKEFEAAGIYLAGFREGARIRREAFVLELNSVMAEEEGARDALSEAFEAQKKYEQVVDNAKAAEAKEEARRETAAFDELGLRRASR